MTFCRCLKEEEIEDFQSLLEQISNIRVSERLDSRVWSLEASRRFTVKSITNFLSPSCFIDALLLKVLQKFKSLRRVNILVWIMVFGYLNCSAIMQRKLPSHCLSPSVCHLWLVEQEDLPHLFFDCAYSKSCWWKLFSLFNLA